MFVMDQDNNYLFKKPYTTDLINQTSNEFQKMQCKKKLKNDCIWKGKFTRIK